LDNILLPDTPKLEDQYSAKSREGAGWPNFGMKS